MWSSNTGRFGDEEMILMETTDASELIGLILNSDPLVALRVLAEIMLNEDFEKLDELLRDAEVNEHWQKYPGDSEIDIRDLIYATRLRERLESLS